MTGAKSTERGYYMQVCSSVSYHYYIRCDFLAFSCARRARVLTRSEFLNGLLRSSHGSSTYRRRYGFEPCGQSWQVK